MRLIDADSLKRYIGDFAFNNLDYLPDWAYDRIIKIVDCEKTVDAEPIVHARWIKHISEDYPADSTIECSCCCEEQNISISENYCPHCGAKMDG